MVRNNYERTGHNNGHISPQPHGTPTTMISQQRGRSHQQAGKPASQQTSRPEKKVLHLQSTCAKMRITNFIKLENRCAIQKHLFFNMKMVHLTRYIHLRTHDSKAQHASATWLAWSSKSGPNKVLATHRKGGLFAHNL